MESDGEKGKSLQLARRMPEFRLSRNVHENVRELRIALGSVYHELSLADLGKLVTEQHPTRSVSASTVQRWEKDVEPDYDSVTIMAMLAGCTFEEFAKGNPEAEPTVEQAEPAALPQPGEEPKYKPGTLVTKHEPKPHATPRKRGAR